VGSRTETTSRRRWLSFFLRAKRGIAMSGTTPDPPPMSSAGASPRQTKKPPIGPEPVVFLDRTKDVITRHFAP
jgi:hypothetical protein